MPQAVPAGRAAGIGWPLRGGPPNPDAVASARVTATNPGGHRRDDRAEADPVDEQAGGDDPDGDGPYRSRGRRAEGPGALDGPRQRCPMLVAGVWAPATGIGR